MNKLAIKILTAPLGRTHVFFLGQAGFIFKSTKGTLLAVDLYLSDCVERYDGFKRLMPHLLEPSEIAFDYVVTTHWHYDHFDVDAIPIMLANEQTKLIASIDCKGEAKRLQIPTDRVSYVKCGDQHNAGDILLHAVFCDHGEKTPDAVGIVIEIDGKKIYIAGDTALRLDKAPQIMDLGSFDLMIAPINGAFGNLNEEEAATLCGFHKPKLFVPCHFWNFAEQGGNPGLFADNIRKSYPDQRYRLMAIGESIIL